MMATERIRSWSLTSSSVEGGDGVKAAEGIG